MPYRSEWAPAELALEHNGVCVYHTYKNDDIDQGPKLYWFVLDRSEGEEDAFDVRDLELPEDFDVDSDVYHALRTAIDLGLLKNPE